jgi:septum formation protein
MINLNALLVLPAPLVLASASPRRQALLQHIGLTFSTVHPDIDEDAVSTSTEPSKYVEELARRKSLQGALMVGEDAIVLGSDTTVVLDGTVLNKPTDEADAIAMLQRLSGRTHTVYTGIALVRQATGQAVVTSRSTDVTFRELSMEEIVAYVGTGSPMDKAGAYGIQDDFGAVFVRHVHGCYYTIVGLPLELVYSSLKAFSRGHS